MFKLHAGGRRAKSDVLEVLSRHPESFRLDRRLDAWLREAVEV